MHSTLNQRAKSSNRRDNLSYKLNLTCSHLLYMQSTITDFRYRQKKPTIYVGPSIGRSLRRKTAFKSLQLGWPYIWPCLQHKYQQNQQTELVHPSVGPSVKKRQALSLKTVADRRGHATYLDVWSVHWLVDPSIYRRTHISAFLSF